MADDKPDLDLLTTNSLRAPMLDQLMTSMHMKAEVGLVAEEIKRRYLAKLSRHNNTGNLASTAQVTYHRSHLRDRRWEAEFSVGGAKAPYVLPLEEEYHILGSVLHDMGFGGGGGRTGPTGTVPKAHSRPSTPKGDVADREEESNIKSGEQTQRPAPNVNSRRLRAGLYEVSNGERTFRVEQRFDIPGQPWWASDPDATFDPHMGDFRTKGDAVRAMTDLIKREQGDS